MKAASKRGVGFGLIEVWLFGVRKGWTYGGLNKVRIGETYYIFTSTCAQIEQSRWLKFDESMLA